MIIHMTREIYLVDENLLNKRKIYLLQEMSTNYKFTQTKRSLLGAREVYLVQVKFD